MRAIFRNTAVFSLGEAAAAAYSSIFDLEMGFRLVCRRGKLMQHEAEKFKTSMTGIVTGGSRGIGEAIACKLASPDTNIAVIYGGNNLQAEKVCKNVVRSME